MELHRNEKGQMLVMTAFELLLLIGFLALAADVGVLFHSKRHMQAAADSAATAAALNDYNYSMGYTSQSDSTAALDAAKANGYTDGKDGVTVTVNTPPLNGYHLKSGYVEVIISKSDPLYFFKVFTGNGSTTVAARAVAGDPVGQTGCINVDTLYLKGSATIQGEGGTLACGIDVKNSIYNNDNGTVINAAYLHTPSGASEKKATSPTPTTSGYNPPNSYFTSRYMPDPSDSGSNTAGGTSICSTGTPASPGPPATSAIPSNIYSSSTYNTGSATDAPLPTPSSFTYGTVTIDNVYCFSKNVTFGANSSSVTNLPSGFYFFQDGATFNGSITFGADKSPTDGNPAYSECYPSSTADSNPDVGAVLYNYAGAIVQKNGQLGVCGPKDGEYNGIAIMQPTYSTASPPSPPANNNSLDLQFGMSGNAGTTCSLADAALNGYIVAPDATVTMHDNGGGLLVTGIVAAELDINSSTLSVCNYNTVNSDSTPLRSIALVE